MKKIPLRRCLGCMESKPKNALCRIVKTKEGKIIVDKIGKIEGRGAYICYDDSCFEKARKARRLEKEFESSISDETYEELRREVSSGR